MKIETSVNAQGQIYIPQKIRDATGLTPDRKIVLVGDTRAIFVFPTTLSSEDALKSLDMVSRHLKHEAEMSKKEKSEKR